MKILDECPPIQLLFFDAERACNYKKKNLNRIKSAIETLFLRFIVFYQTAIYDSLIGW